MIGAVRPSELHALVRRLWAAAAAAADESVKLRWRTAPMITTFPAYRAIATRLEQVRAFAKGGSARIQR